MFAIKNIFSFSLSLEKFLICVAFKIRPKEIWYLFKISSKFFIISLDKQINFKSIEKLLLFGGAIQEAGAVKSHKIKKSATSDFMEIEKQRGISVSTSVLAFNYKEIKITSRTSLKYFDVTRN